MNHTPGPWTKDGTTINAPPIKAKYNFRRLIARVYETAVLTGEPDHIEADAMLIAAAPDLLEACIAALGTWPVSLDTKETRQLRAAIAKARGQS